MTCLKLLVSPWLLPLSRVDTDVHLEVAYSCSILLFLTLWHVTHKNKLMPLWHHWAFWNTRALKWPHRVISGSKIKSAPIFLKVCKIVGLDTRIPKMHFFFQIRHVVLTLGVINGQRLVFKLNRGQKIKLLRFSWKWWHIVLLPIGIQKKNSLHYLQCLLHMFLNQNVTGHHSPMAINLSYIVSWLLDILDSTKYSFSE